MKRILISSIFLSLWISSLGQPTNLGFRGGFSSGFTAQIEMDQWHSAAALLSFRNGGMQFTAMKIRFEPFPIPWLENTRLYSGWGIHLGYIREYYGRNEEEFYPSYYKRSGPAIGGDCILGLAWSLNRIPITITLDAKPYFEFSTLRIFRLNIWDIGFGIQYNFNY